MKEFYLTDEVKKWQYNINKNQAFHEIYSTKFFIPKGMFFHSYEKFEKSDAIGVGQLQFIVSSSESDPTYYPLIKVFKIGKSDFSSEKLENQFILYLNFLKKNQLINEFHKIKSTHSKEFFWTFYDKIRPRYSKIGFILYQNSQEFYIIQIIENLQSDQTHELIIQKFKDSLGIL